MRDRISITVVCTTVGGRALEQPWVQERGVFVCELGGKWVERVNWSGGII